MAWTNRVFNPPPFSHAGKYQTTGDASGYMIINPSQNENGFFWHKLCLLMADDDDLKVFAKRGWIELGRKE